MVSSGSPPSRRRAPPERGTNPATSRNREDLPTPLGPTTTRASPPPTVKLRPEKTWRPPRKQARSDPKRRIRSSPPPAPIPAARDRKRKNHVGKSASAGLHCPGGLPGRPLTARHLPAMALKSVDYLEHRKKRTYKPEPSGLILAQPSRRSRPAITGACWYHGNAPCFNPDRKS